MAKKSKSKCGNGHTNGATDKEEKVIDNRFCPGLIKIMVDLKNTKEVLKKYHGHVADGAD